MADTECAWHIKGSVCCSVKMLNKMQQFYKKKTGHLIPLSRKKELVQALAKLLDVKSESGILANEEFSRFAGSGRVDLEKYKRFKTAGPWNTTGLLDNFNIDNTLKQFEQRFSSANCKFYAVPFQMIDFEETRSELANLSIADLSRKGYNCMGVVINTDYSFGPGKHWFCLFWDGRGAGTADDPWTLEYFNSSGNRPLYSVHHWMRRQIMEIMRDLRKTCEFVISANQRLQNDHHSCGVWCLAYIYYRLKGIAPTFFIDKNMTDADMIRFRRKLFRKYE